MESFARVKGTRKLRKRKIMKEIERKRKSHTFVAHCQRVLIRGKGQNVIVIHIFLMKFRFKRFQEQLN